MTCREHFTKFKSQLTSPNKWDDEQIWDMACVECPLYVPTPGGFCENIDESANSDFN